MAHAFKSWGYKLDYDKEIATDLAEIEAAERHLPLAAAATAEERLWAKQHGGLSIVTFLFEFGKLEERAALLGINLEAAYDYAEQMEIVLPGVPERGPGWYSMALQVDKYLDKQFGGYIDLEPQARLTALRARLARHRRNQKKFGS